MTPPVSPSLMQIRAFLYVVETGSISKAAAALFRAQSAVTRSIISLESSLGVSVFERNASGMRLTRQGASILPRAKRAVAELLCIPQILGRGKERAGEPLYLFQNRRLEIFARLCETQNMQTAAMMLGISQPAISAAIKILEQGCGVSLFERTPQGLLPTRMASAVLLHARRALNELRHLDADITFLDGVVRGTVHVGALPLGRTHILPQAIVRLTGRHPGVSIVTNESPFDLLASELRSGDVDFVFGALRSSSYGSDLQGEELMRENLVILMRRGHPWSGKPVTPEMLASAKWVLPRSGSPARDLLLEFFIHIGISSPPPVVETGDLAILRGVLLNSDMLAAVSTHQLQYEINSKDLVPVPLVLNHTSRPIGLTYRAAALQSPAAHALMGMIRQVVSEMHAG
jgi:LysR family transcriptional regulator of gallate degradation